MKKFFLANRRLLLCILVLLLSAMVYSAYRSSDVLSRTVKGKDFTLANAAAADGDTLVSTKSGFRGTLGTSQKFSLPKGTFTVHVTIDADSEASHVLLEAPENASTASADNQRGCVYARFTQKQNRATVTFDDAARELVFRAVQDGKQVSVGNITIKSNGFVYNDAVFFALVAAIAGLWAVFSFRPGRKPTAYWPWACAALALMATLPLFRQYLVHQHDLPFHFARIEGLAQGLAHGQWPVRINTFFNGGYGMAEPTMYPNLFYYFPALLRVGGVSLLTSYQAFVLGINVLTAVLAYKSMMLIGRRHGLALLFTALYVFAQYRLLNIYTRAALGELLAMAFFPCVMAGLYHVLRGNTQRWPWLAAGMLGLLFSHVLSLLMAAVGCAVCLLCTLRGMKRANWTALGWAAGVTVLLGAWVWIPLLYYNDPAYCINRQTQFLTTSGAYPGQLFGLMAGEAAAGNRMPDTTQNEMSYAVGLALVFGLLAFWAARALWGRDKAYHGLGKAATVLAVTGLYLASTLTRWDLIVTLPFIGQTAKMIQYVWRFLGPASAGLALVGSLGYWRLRGSTGRSALLAVGSGVLLAVVLATPYLDAFTASSPKTVTLPGKHTEFRPYYQQDYLRAPVTSVMEKRGPVLTVPSGVTVRDLSRQATSLTAMLGAAEGQSLQGVVEIPLYWYEGYRATFNGQPLSVFQTDSGFVSVVLPDDVSAGVLSVWYDPPAAFRVAEGITLLTAAGLLAGWILCRKKHSKTANPDTACGDPQENTQAPPGATAAAGQTVLSPPPDFAQGANE